MPKTPANILKAQKEYKERVAKYEAQMIKRCDELYPPRLFVSAFFGALKLHRERIDLDSMIENVKNTRYKHSKQFKRIKYLNKNT